jgi:hypothetical protein
LRFVGEQYAVTLPQLASLMGRSEHAARWLRSRWQRAGWAQGRALLVGEPVFVWLTRRGLRAAGLPYRAWRPSPGGLAHVVAVNEVRIELAERRPEAGWVCERELAREARTELGGFGAHRPDGLVLVHGGEVAVEVELTLKRRGRVERVMREHVARYGQVWYFAPPRLRRALEEAAAGFPADRVRVLPLFGEEGA